MLSLMKSKKPFTIWIILNILGIVKKLSMLFSDWVMHHDFLCPVLQNLAETESNRISSHLQRGRLREHAAPDEKGPADHDENA